MTALDLIRDLRSTLAQLRGRGQEVVPVVGLDRYLEAIEKDVASSEADAGRSREAEKARFSHEMEIWKVRTPLIFQSVITAGQNALKATMLINGGAVVALLAFTQSLISKDKNVGVAIGRAMLVFSSGVLLSAVAAALTYLTQLFAQNAEREGLSTGFNMGAVAAGVLSLVAFGVGSWLSFRAIRW